MKLDLPPPSGLPPEEMNRRIVGALAALKRAVDKLEARLAAAGIA